MTQGCRTSENGKFKLGGRFVAYRTRVGTDSEGEATYGWYSYELGGWVRDEDVEGVSDTVKEIADGSDVYSDSGKVTVFDSVDGPFVFCGVSVSTFGGGSVAVGADTVYGGRYVKSGSTVSLEAVPDPGRRKLSLKVDGADYDIPVEVTSDIVVTAEFCPTTYSVRHMQPAGGGSSEVRVGGAVVQPGGERTGVPVGTRVEVAAAEAPGAAFLYVEVDGTRYVDNPHSFDVYDRVGDGTFDVRCAFGSVATATDSVSVSGSGSVSVRRGSAVVRLDEAGRFVANVGSVYSVLAVPGEEMRVGGIYENGRLVTSSSNYSFVQDSAARDLTVAFVSARDIDVTLFSGGDTYSRTETWNGCSCSAEVPHGTTVGTYTFTPSFTPEAAGKYVFSSLYVEDLDGTGKGSVIPAEGSSPVSAYIDFNARVVAIFEETDAPAEPEDEDQGGDPQPTEVALRMWEGSEARMTATWRSGRVVYTKPVSFSSARVMANGYSESLPVLRLACYESPSVSDPAETVATVACQDAFRLPKRRPEKYVEVEVSSDSRVLEVAVSTSMEGLWQASS